MSPTPADLSLPAAARPLLEALLDARRRHRALAHADWAAAEPGEALAHALQHAQGVALGEWAPGDTPRHWKSGAGAREQALLHAALLPSGVHRAGPSGEADLSATPFFQPLVEAEVALRLGRAVGADEAAALDAGTAADWAGDLVDAVAVSVELVDTRWDALAATPAGLKLADFQVHGALVLGEWRPWRAVDWSAQTGTLQLDAAAPRQFRGSHPLGSPLWGLAGWLRHLTREGRPAPAGTVVSTGAWCGGVPVARGQRVQVAFDGLGAVGLRL